MKALLGLFKKWKLEREKRQRDRELEQHALKLLDLMDDAARRMAFWRDLAWTPIGGRREMEALAFLTVALQTLKEAEPHLNRPVFRQKVCNRLSLMNFS